MRESVPDHRCSGPFDSGSRLCNACQRRPEETAKPCARLVAESATMRAVLRRAIPIAASSAPVVILGETGTGKEVLARALHASGPRADRAFVAINCGAMPGELIESELFGHARGAFSGAVSEKRGLFEEANGGTLLLDEIAEIPLQLQVKLLRVLQDGEVRRVGANHALAVDVRVLAATHRDLSSLLKTGAFREDLYYRLKVFSLRLPPLRDRPEDILPLARDILVHQPGLATRFSPDARRALLDHRWPGNIRELANAMRHAAALARSECVEVEDLPDDIVEAWSPQAALSPLLALAPGSTPVETLRPAASGLRLEPLADVERRHLLAVLEACRGNQAEAARVLGIARNTLWRKLEAYHRDGSIPAAPGPGEC
jgi:two-component system response regulator HydG